MFWNTNVFNKVINFKVNIKILLRYKAPWVQMIKKSNVYKNYQDLKVNLIEISFYKNPTETGL